MQNHSSFIIRPSSFPRQRAFTLVEMLVVVSIIVLLVAIILPAIGKARDQSALVVCQTRIKAFGLATQEYLTEYNGSFPINGLLFPKSGIPAIYANPPGNRYAAAEVKDQQKWRPEWGALWTYMGGVDVTSTLTPTPNNIQSTPFLPPIPATVGKAFLCPTDVVNSMPRTNPGTAPANGPLTFLTTNNIATVQVGPASNGYWSYSINSVLNSLGRLRDNPQFDDANGNTSLPWNDPLNMVNIKSPETFIFFLEEDQHSLFNDEVMEPPTFRSATENTERLSNRHNNGGNVGFGDGHCEWFNEIVFDNGSVQSSITRLFFPDGGEFLNGP